MLFTVTVISKSNQRIDYEVNALNVDDAIDEVLEKIPYDATEIFCEDMHCYL